MPTRDKMIPSNVDTANKTSRPDIVLKHKKEKTALLIEVSVPIDYGPIAPEIRKMTKCLDLKNEVKRMWKLMKAENVPVIVRAAGMKKKPLSEYLKIIPGNITRNELQVEAVRGSVKILKRALGTRQ